LRANPSFAPLGLSSFSDFLPWLAPWAAFFRRFAAGRGRADCTGDLPALLSGRIVKDQVLIFAIRLHELGYLPRRSQSTRKRGSIRGREHGNVPFSQRQENVGPCRDFHAKMISTERSVHSRLPPFRTERGRVGHPSSGCDFGDAPKIGSATRQRAERMGRQRQTRSLISRRSCVRAIRVTAGAEILYFT